MRGLFSPRIIPAYAGSTGSSSATTIWSMGSSPHTRGALLIHPGSLGVFRIIPAYAGSTPSTSGQVGGDADHPRIRGEHDDDPTPRGRDNGSSPHTRGALGSEPVLGLGEGIIPAYAGSTRRVIGTLPKPAWIIPAYAGSTVGVHMIVVDGLGSSPHTRGAPSLSQWIAGLIRIIPAYAGSTACPWRKPKALQDHPRIRGEHLRRNLRASHD